MSTEPRYDGESRRLADAKYVERLREEDIRKMATKLTPSTDLSVERIDELSAVFKHAKPVRKGVYYIQEDWFWPLLAMARRCAVAEATLRHHDSWYGDCVVERDKLRERVQALETFLHEEGERATRLQDELDKANEDRPDRRFQAACAAMTGLILKLPIRLGDDDNPTPELLQMFKAVGNGSVRYADAMLAALATPTARAEGKEPT